MPALNVRIEDTSEQQTVSGSINLPVMIIVLKFFFPVTIFPITLKMLQESTFCYSKEK